jgi:hypothetical protein
MILRFRCCLVWLQVGQLRQVQLVLRLFVALCGCDSVNCGRFGRQLQQVQSILWFSGAIRLAMCGCESVNCGRCIRFCGFLLHCVAVSQSITAGAIDFAVSVAFWLAVCGCESVNFGRCNRFCGFVVALCGCESVNCGRFGRRLLRVSQWRQVRQVNQFGCCIIHGGSVSATKCRGG